MSLFASVELVPGDPILGLTEAYNADPRTQKVNLGVGIYYDEQGRIPLLDCVRQVEQALAAAGKPRGYLPIDGLAAYAAATRELVFGKESELVAAGRVATTQTVGGRGALRVGADLLKKLLPHATIAISNPSWENHRAVFGAAGFDIVDYTYFDAATHGLDFAGMLADLDQLKPGTVVLLHACCHNPTGVDPTREQWQRIVQVFARRPLIAFLDFAYQGFGRGVEEDAFAVRTFASAGLEMIVSNSFSKNFGLYRERVGALTVVTGADQEATAVMSRIKQTVRANYSNPPAHGGKVVELVLGDADLRSLWEREVVEMRDRIHDMRRLFVETLKLYGVKQNFDFLLEQQGMFSFSGIGKEQVRRLREQYGIYIVENGLINVAAMTRARMDYLCRSIAEVLER